MIITAGIIFNIATKAYALYVSKREGYATWLYITRSGVNAYRLDKVLATYRLTDGSVSSNKRKLLKYHYNVYRKHEGFGFIKSHYYLLIHIINKIFKKC